MQPLQTTWQSPALQAQAPQGALPNFGSHSEAALHSGAPPSGRVAGALLQNIQQALAFSADMGQTTPLEI